MPLARRLGLFAGPVVAIGLYLALSFGADDLSPEGRATAAIGALMAIWWMTEALPLPATALLPIVLFPLTGVFSGKDALEATRVAAAPYAHPYIFLYLGGFVVALAIERWNLHRRIALLTILGVGTKPDRIIAGFMIATAGLSMWISNTATTVLMLPIGLSVIGVIAEDAGEEPPEEGARVRPPVTSNFATCLMLSIAYAASIGGVGTLVGTPPNVFLAGYLKRSHDIDLGFGRWMAFGLPLVVVLLSLTWLFLTRRAFPVAMSDLPRGRQLIRNEFEKLGRVSRAEWTVLCVFLLTALGWILREPLTSWGWLATRVPAVTRIHDSHIALVAALALFMIPVGRGVFAMNWETARRLPWGMLLLFGGGLSLAGAMKETRLADWIGATLPSQLPLPVLVLLAVAVVVFLTEITSNLATASAFLPILGGIATAIAADARTLVIPAAIAASCAFMLPVATPPNAIVFGSGRVAIAQMIKAGFWLNLLCVVLIPLLTYLLGSLVLGVEFTRG